jgi:glycosyltransferase involved in cell wall biosynthesis
MINFAFDGITSFSTKPLRFITTLGILFMFVSASLICYGLYRYITDSVIEGWTSLMLSLWFIGGAILTCLGIIGEYIGRIYQEVKNRPRYFIEKETDTDK